LVAVVVAVVEVVKAAAGQAAAGLAAAQTAAHSAVPIVGQTASGTGTIVAATVALVAAVAAEMNVDLAAAGDLLAAGQVVGPVAGHPVARFAGQTGGRTA
jgi:hypothetical protein